MATMTGGRLCKAKQRGEISDGRCWLCEKQKESHENVKKASIVNNEWWQLGRHLDLRHSRDPRESYQIVVVFPDV